MLIVTHDHDDTTVVRAVVDLETFAREINHEGGIVKEARK
jgi:hypothetical protein